MAHSPFSYPPLLSFRFEVSEEGRGERGECYAFLRVIYSVIALQTAAAAVVQILCLGRGRERVYLFN